MSQNQLATRPPHHSRGSARSSPISEAVERATLGSTVSSWDQHARAPAQQSEGQDQRAERRGAAAALGGDATRDGAEEDREERRAFDQRIAGRQFLAREMVGQDAVFDWTE